MGKKRTHDMTSSSTLQKSITSHYSPSINNNNNNSNSNNNPSNPSSSNSNNYNLLDITTCRFDSINVLGVQQPPICYNIGGDPYLKSMNYMTTKESEMFPEYMNSEEMITMKGKTKKPMTMPQNEKFEEDFESSEEMVDHFLYEDFLDVFPLSNEVDQYIEKRVLSLLPEDAFTDDDIEMKLEVSPSRSSSRETPINPSEKRRLQVKEASKRCRQRQKDELSFLRKKVNELQEQVSELQIGVNPPEQSVWELEARTKAAECAILGRENEMIQEKLVQHNEWRQRLSEFVSMAPLHSFTLGTGLMIFEKCLEPLHEKKQQERKTAQQAVLNLMNLSTELLHPSCSYMKVKEDRHWKVRASSSHSLLTLHATSTLEIQDRALDEIANSLWQMCIEEKKIKDLFPCTALWEIEKDISPHIKVGHVIHSLLGLQRDMQVITALQQMQDQWVLAIETMDKSHQTISSNMSSGNTDLPTSSSSSLLGGAILRKNNKNNCFVVDFLGCYDVEESAIVQKILPLVIESIFSKLECIEKVYLSSKTM